VSSLSKIAKWAAIIAALFIVTMTVLSRRPGAGRNEYTIVIDRAPAEVFPWITEPYRLTRWVDGLESSTPLKGDSAVRGAKSRDVVLAGGKRYTFVTEIVEIKRDTMLVTRSDSDPKGFSIRAMYELVPSGPGTRLHYVGTADYESVFAQVMEPIVTRRAQGKIEADMKHLKELIEAQPGKPGI
jgi:uncharacterized protein YndB with AHSA1/START domain